MTDPLLQLEKGLAASTTSAQAVKVSSSEQNAAGQWLTLWLHNQTLAYPGSSFGMVGSCLSDISTRCAAVMCPFQDVMIICLGSALRHALHMVLRHTIPGQ